MKNVCGLDIHKDTIFACILNDKGERELREYSTMTPYLFQLRDDLKRHGVKQEAMERTGIYWIPIWRGLESDFDLTEYTGA